MTKKILDLGCGDCSFVETGKSGGKKEMGYLGIDIDLNKLQYCKDKGYEILQMDLDNNRLPFNSNTFDLVIARDIVEHLYSHFKLIKESFRVLKNGGTFYIRFPSEFSLAVSDDYTHTGKAWTKSAIVHELSDVGFTIVDITVSRRITPFTKDIRKAVSFFFLLVLKKLTGIDFITSEYVVRCYKK